MRRRRAPQPARCEQDIRARFLSFFEPDGHMAWVTALVAQGRSHFFLYFHLSDAANQMASAGTLRRAQTTSGAQNEHARLAHIAGKLGRAHGEFEAALLLAGCYAANSMGNGGFSRFAQDPPAAAGGSDSDG